MQINEEYINEMSIAWVDQKANKCCWVENPTGYNNKYFKYVNSFSYIKGDYMARISMLSPKYLDYKNMSRKRFWKLTNKEKQELINTMNKSNKNFPQCTNWQITLAQYNMDNFGIDLIDTINSTFSIDEYPDAFDINTSMPDYTKLK